MARAVVLKDRLEVCVDDLFFEGSEGSAEALPWPLPPCDPPDVCFR